MCTAAKRQAACAQMSSHITMQQANTATSQCKSANPTHAVHTHQLHSCWFLTAHPQKMVIALRQMGSSQLLHACCCSTSRPALLQPMPCVPAQLLPAPPLEKLR